MHQHDLSSDNRWLCLNRDSGITLVEMLVGIGIMMTLFTGILSSFVNTTRRSYDTKTVNLVDEQARAILDLVAYDARMIGSGMPLAQLAFDMTNTALGDAPLPILLTSAEDYLQLRLNEIGRDTVLTQSFAPSTTNLSFTAFSVADLNEGDTIYISSMPVGATTGMQAVIDAVDDISKTVTIENSYVTVAGAVFASGSVVSRVRTITYDSPSDWSGILRNTGSGATLVAANSTFAIDYLDATGTELTPPLTAAQVKTNLTSLRITVSVRGSKPLAGGDIYTGTATQLVALRNLILSR